MQRRITVSILISIATILVALWVISYLSVRDSIQRSLDNRLRLAQIVANHINSTLQGNLTRLFDISISGAVDLRDGDWEPEKKALKTAYQYSIFTDGVFITDLSGNILLIYPGERKKESLFGIPAVREALQKKRAIITDVYSHEGINKNVIFVLAPLRDKRGEIVGLVGGEINPTNYLLNTAIKAMSLEKSVDIELVDSKGTVIASNDPSRLFTCSDHNRFLGELIQSKKTAVTRCHHCHAGDNLSSSERTTEMLAFCPLPDAPWGVSVREAETSVFAPAMRLKRRFALLGIVSMGSALLLALGLSKSIVNPIKSLILASKRIAEGNLNEPVRSAGGSEIELLGASLESMRQNLKSSLERIRKYNEELEKRIEERTAEITANRRRLAMLLDEIIEAQEEERKRIARELHDETSQMLAALGMSVEIAALAYEEGNLSKESIYELKRRVEQAMDSLNLIIKDLRPPILDDLGLESAIKWLIDTHLAEKGINCYLSKGRRFKEMMEILSERGIKNSKAELMIFRLIQEALANIARHSRAGEVFVNMNLIGKDIVIGIDDDGVGFDINSAFIDGHYGILGMKERAELLGGTLRVCSRPGEGTSISIRIPQAVFGLGYV